MDGWVGGWLDGWVDGWVSAAHNYASFTLAYS